MGEGLKTATSGFEGLRANSECGEGFSGHEGLKTTTSGFGGKSGDFPSEF